jgi:MinD superfamily P-loop ATPase
MKIAIASGKGGTGKTTVAVNLALVAGSGTRLLDCDVEEPNAHLFLKPTIARSEPVTVLVPQVEAKLCNACGQCGAFCRFHAIVTFKTQPLLFPELCHACGGCAKVCPTKAIAEVPREIGVIEYGRSGDVEFVHGVLRVGEAMSPPLIRAVRSADFWSAGVPPACGQDGRSPGSAGVPPALQLIDAPPGTSCPVIAAVRGVDLVLLVTEPTPFGLHDLTLAVETLRELKLSMAVVLNRAGIGDHRVQAYCRAENLPLLAELPDDRRVAEAYSRGVPIVDAIPEMRARFEELLAAVRELAHVHLTQKKGASNAHV